MEEKMINNIPLSTWKKAFADTVAIAIDKDYFSDTLFYDLNFSCNTNEEIQYAWECVEEAFKEIFGTNLRSY